jgi:two-component system, cell cycle sensor histidine kinase and response regulator CckA
MNAPRSEPLPRILIVDDNAAIHGDFRKILGEQPVAQGHLDDVEKALFGGADAPVERAGFRIDSAYQGQEALTLVQRALQENDPYVMAFVDVRMPPGWDGVETLGHLWKCCPELQAVICTAYSDYSWDDIARRLAQTDNLLILKKPFDTIEALQITHALTRKWALARQAKLRMEDLDRMVRERTQKLSQEMEERGRVQEALRVSEERFSKAFSASPMPMGIQTRAEGRFLDANSSFLDLTGYAAGQLLQHTADELQLLEPGSAGSPAAMRLQDRIRNRPVALKRHDGAKRNVVLWTEPITLGTDPCLLVIMEDMTEHLKLETQLRQSQKMEAVGCLAAGIAHEFNNLLTVIQGHAGLLRATPDPRAASESVERIAQASQRAASLTRRLLSFSRKQPVQLKPLNLSAVVQSLQKMLGQLIGERHQLSLECAADLPPTRADEGNLEQVLINLVLNARDAMPQGGTIKIATSLAIIDEAAARESLDARPGRFVCVGVSDSGCGMTKEVLSRIFDPFYTTKDIGKGTGLGLSTVHAIVEQHQGWIEVNSQVAHGSTFKVFLPALAQEPAPASKTADPNHPGPLSASGEAILVVEDEATVRDMARLALEQAGYRVLDAADGQQALSVWERTPLHIDLLLTDMVMPNGLSGSDLAKELQTRDPLLRTLYTTGYSSEVVREGLHLKHGINFLPKPYDSATLLKTVSLCLKHDGNGRPLLRPAGSLIAETSGKE